MDSQNLPISTQWLLEASNSTNKVVIENVFLIFCQKTSSKGTGFLINSGQIITNWHVVKDCTASDVIALSSANKQIKFKEIIVDQNRDLAILVPVDALSGGLEIDDSSISTETKVLTWGHPLAYNGPSPILSVGYVAGFNTYQKDSSSNVVKRYIVNGALNPGNSGGPVFVDGSNKVIGVVVAKHAPITQFLKSALDVLAKNQSGVVFSGTNDKGEPISFVESQIVAMLLEHQRNLTQVMLGEVILSNEMSTFLKEKNFLK